MNRFFVPLAIISLPIYPASGSFLYNKTGGQLNYDSSTIISSYDAQENESGLQEDGFMDLAIAVEENRDWSDREEIEYYVVQEWDSLNSLVEDFQLQKNTLIWANGIVKEKIKIGDELTILPMNGILYTVKKSDSISRVADLHEIAAWAVLKANNLPQGYELKIGEKIILPWAKPYVTIASTQKNFRGPDGVVRGSINGKFTPKIVNPGGRGFVPGHCTFFVAQRLDITWRGHAKSWYQNAINQGKAVWQVAKPWAAIVWRGPGYNVTYGHVGVVIEVQDEHIIVQDMNYAGLWVVTTRKESIHNSRIVGYVYP